MLNDLVTEDGYSILPSRIQLNSIPLFFGFHTEELKEITSGEIVNCLAGRVKPVIGILNLTDFIESCISSNLYKCCAHDYTPLVFKNARRFMTDLLVHDEVRAELQADFDRVLLLFGCDLFLMNIWLHSIYKLNPEESCLGLFCPTVPSRLPAALKSHAQDVFTSWSGKCFDALTSSDFTIAVGNMLARFPYGSRAGLREYFDDQQVPLEWRSYLAELLINLNMHDPSVFTLYYNIGGEA